MGRGLATMRVGLMLTLAWTALGGSSAAAQDAGEGHNAQELAKKLANPVGDLVSLPFQFNWENGVGPDEGLRTVLNIQPVVPISISPNWNVIGRWILPYLSQPASLGASAGFSDVTFSAFLSPSAAQSLVWGVGPVLILPMTSDSTLGALKWSAGPTAVVLKIQGPWLYGLLANHVWSYAATSNVKCRDVNQTFLQPFIAYCTANGVTYSLQSESTANWEAAEDSDTWTIPINFIVSKVTKFGPFPFSIQGGGGVYVASPDGGPEWKLRANFVVMLPRK